MSIENSGITCLFLDSLPEFANPQLHQFVKGGRDWILRFGLVNEATSESAVSLNKTFECFTRIVINQAFEPIDTFGNGCCRYEH